MLQSKIRIISAHKIKQGLQLVAFHLEKRLFGMMIAIISVHRRERPGKIGDTFHRAGRAERVFRQDLQDKQDIDLSADRQENRVNPVHPVKRFALCVSAVNYYERRFTMKQWKKAFTLCLVIGLVTALVLPHQVYSQGWSDFTIRSLPDSSFALVEIDKNKVRHFPYRDMGGDIDIDQLIYCVGTFANETWVDPRHKDAARKHLEEHYHRFKFKQLKEEITRPVDINEASLKDLVRLPNIGPVMAVRIYQYRETHGPFQNVEEIKKVEGIGRTIFAGIRYYIRVR